jgi:hypothetical protein
MIDSFVFGCFVFYGVNWFSFWIFFYLHYFLLWIVVVIYEKEPDIVVL